MVIYPWNFAHVKDNHEKKSSSRKFSIFFQLWSSYTMFLKHLLLHDVIVMMKIVNFLSFFFFFSIEYVDGLCVIFTILHIKKENFKINIKNGNLLLNRGSKSMFIELLMYFYTMIQQPINCILMGLILSFYVWNSN
jgi:hypothetical protein